VTGDDVRQAADLGRSVLEPAQTSDWSVPVPGLDFTVASVVGHVAVAMLWYAVDMLSGRDDNACFEVSTQSDGSNERLLTSVLVGAQTLAVGIEAAPPGTRGFHPFGSPDPSGFAAMACDELLVHADDAARGLGVDRPRDERLAGAVLARLYPWHDVGDDDPWQVLLWANGRTDLPGRAFQTRWPWHCQPLSEWDGVTSRATTA
jgi:uncharacterized protein (TIGR03083 family)